MAQVHLQLTVFACALLMILLVSQVDAGREAGCSGNFVKWGEDCKDFILKETPPKDPSKECCAQFQNVDIPCLCRLMPKDKWDVISAEKVVYVAKYCKTPLKSGSKCGSKLSQLFHAIPFLLGA